MRPSGTSGRASAGKSATSNGVSIAPGATTLTRTPSSAPISASERAQALETGLRRRVRRRACGAFGRADDAADEHDAPAAGRERRPGERDSPATRRSGRPRGSHPSASGHPMDLPAERPPRRRGLPVVRRVRRPERPRSRGRLSEVASPAMAVDAGGGVRSSGQRSTSQPSATRRSATAHPIPEDPPVTRQRGRCSSALTVGIVPGCSIPPSCPTPTATSISSLLPARPSAGSEARWRTSLPPASARSRSRRRSSGPRSRRTRSTRSTWARCSRSAPGRPPRVRPRSRAGTARVGAGDDDQPRLRLRA